MGIEPRLYRGMRDYLPSIMLAREGLLEIVRKTFRLWGYAPLATPAIELKEILCGKYGDMVDRLIYKLEHKDGLALRYDLTVPLARAVAMYPELPSPFKRYQIQEVWRAERAQQQKGRFREFLQCDVDIVGSASSLADAEIIALSMKLLDDLGFPDAITRVNHRSLLRGLMEIAGFTVEQEIEVCRIVDKLDKIGEHGVENELLSEGFEKKSIEKLFGIILNKGDNVSLLEAVENEFGNNERISIGIANLREVLDLLKYFSVSKDKLIFDLALSRGLDYYTGIIFESAVPSQPHIGSLTGGGRYDELIGIFTDKKIPAVGITIGLDRILAALVDAGKIENDLTPTKVLVTIFDDKFIPRSIEVANSLREAGISTEIYLESKKLKQQFAYADKLKIPFVLIIGEDEISRGTVSMKDMKTGNQKEISLDAFIEEMKIL